MEREGDEWTVWREGDEGIVWREGDEGTVWRGKVMSGQCGEGR